MSGYVSAPLRRLVELRASHACEYCLIHESDTFLGCQVDHVISEKHGGATIAENLAFACTLCNRAKGPDVGSVDEQTHEFVRLFNPRLDHWRDHFTLCDDSIEPRTPIGRVTIRLLQFNTPDRIVERLMLRRLGRYPPPELVDVIRPSAPR